MAAAAREATPSTLLVHCRTGAGVFRRRLRFCALQLRRAAMFRHAATPTAPRAQSKVASGGAAATDRIGDLDTWTPAPCAPMTRSRRRLGTTRWHYSRRRRRRRRHCHHHRKLCQRSPVHRGTSTDSGHCNALDRYRTLRLAASASPLFRLRAQPTVFARARYVSSRPPATVAPPPPPPPPPPPAPTPMAVRPDAKPGSTGLQEALKDFSLLHQQ